MTIVTFNLGFVGSLQSRWKASCRSTRGLSYANLCFPGPAHVHIVSLEPPALSQEMGDSLAGTWILKGSHSAHSS